MVTKPNILVVDDVEDNIILIRNFFLGQPYNLIAASSGEEALMQVEANKIDLVLLDVVMPGMDGFEVVRVLKRHPSTRLIPIIMITGIDDSQSKLRGIQLGVDDFITKPVNIFELKARAASLIKLKQYTDQLESAESILFSLALTVEAKDPYTKGHCTRLANYGMILARQLGLDEVLVNAIRRGGILHDIGKLAVKDSILLKPGPLTSEEYEIIKKHPVEGEKICQPLQTMGNVLPIIRYHQERYDGSGYPDGLVGDDIPIGARIVAIVDVFDALTTDRPYRKALNQDEALCLMDSEAEKGMWEKKLLKEFTNILIANNLERMVEAPVFEIERMI